MADNMADIDVDAVVEEDVEGERAICGEATRPEPDEQWLRLRCVELAAGAGGDVVTARQFLAFVQGEDRPAEREIAHIAAYISQNIPGQRSEPVVDCVIRLLAMGRDLGLTLESEPVAGVSAHRPSCPHLADRAAECDNRGCLGATGTER